MKYEKGASENMGSSEIRSDSKEIDFEVESLRLENRVLKKRIEELEAIVEGKMEGQISSYNFNQIK